MKSYATNINVANNENLKKRILHIMLWCLGVLAFCYVFLLGNMVFNIVGRRVSEIEARSLLNEVGSLESQYFSISNKVDLSLAESMGFKETKDKQYAVRKSLGSIKLTTNEL